MSYKRLVSADYDRMNQEILSQGITVKSYYYQNIDRLSRIKLMSFCKYISEARRRALISNTTSHTVSVVELTKADLAIVKAKSIANKNIKGEAAMVNISYGNVTFEVNSDNAPKLIADTIMSLHNSAKAK